MQFSGYNEKFRKEVLRSDIEAYERIKRDIKEGKRPLYRKNGKAKKNGSKKKYENILV